MTAFRKIHHRDDSAIAAFPVSQVEYIAQAFFWDASGTPMGWSAVTDGRCGRDEAFDALFERFAEDYPTIHNCRLIRIDWAADIGGCAPAEDVTAEFLAAYKAAAIAEAEALFAAE